MTTPNERFNATDEPSDSGRLALVSLADVEPQRVEWLWDGRIPMAKLTLLAGIAGLGKSFLTLDMASRVSNGTPWPDSRDDYNPQGRVIILSAEDALADTVRPRLDCAKANMEWIDAIQGVHLTDRTGQRSFDLQRDLFLLSEAMEDMGDVRLIIFDPIDSYLGQGVNANREADVRRVIGPLAELAENTGAAVIAVKHLNKSQAENALFRICGSVAYGAIARSAWLIAEDPGDPGRRLFLKLKLNLAEAAPNLAFTIWNGMVLWSEGEVDMTADEVLGERQKDKDETPSKIGDAAEWLQEALSKGAQKSTDILKWSAENGIAKSTLNRAKAKLRIKPHSIWGGNKITWYWSLPQDTHDEPTENLDHLGYLEHLGREQDSQDTQGTHLESVRSTLDSSPEQPSDRLTSENGEAVRCANAGTAGREPSEPGPR